MLTWNGKEIKSVAVGSTVPTDQTATAEDIKLGKTASINGVKVTGTLELLDKADLLKKLVDIRQDATYLFNKAESLTTENANELIREDTFVNANAAYGLFAFCKRIEVLPVLYLPKVTTFYYAFDNCMKLKAVTIKQSRYIDAMVNAFQKCYSLEELYMDDIKANLQINQSSYLKKESLIYLISQLRNTGSAKTLTMGSTNLAKITGDNAVYVRTIDITDEMRAEDDLIDEKLPFEICESTDDGAMLITEYAQLKNWQLA